MRNFRILPVLTLLICVSATLLSSPPLLTPQAKEEGKSKVKMVTLHTNHGDIVIRLFADKAPKTVENFLRYAREGYYDNTLFHRVIDGFMIQGGGFGPGMRRKPTHEPIMNEADNGLRNTVGTVAMARTGDPHSATSQFFINVANTTFLNHTSRTQQGWGYCVFGKVSKGMDVVNRIKRLATTSRGAQGDVPKEDVIIESATVTEEN